MECLLGMKGFIKGQLFSLFQRESIYYCLIKTNSLTERDHRYISYIHVLKTPGPGVSALKGALN